MRRTGLADDGKAAATGRRCGSEADLASNVAFDPDLTPPRQHKRGKELSLNLTVTIDHAAPRDVPVMHSTTIPVDMTIVCIDILKRILFGESQTERTDPLSSDIVASGLD